MTIGGFERDFRRFGLAKALRKSLFVLINKVVLPDVLDVARIDIRKTAALPIEMPARYRFEVLDEEQAIAFGKDNPESNTSPEFVHAAFADGHTCFGFFEGDEIVSAKWASRGPTVIAEGQTIHFSDTCVYGYKAFTLPAHRGQKLFTYGKLGTARHFAKQGCVHQFGVADTFNYASRGASAVIGEREIGRISVLRIFGRNYVWHSPGCRMLGLKLVVDS